MALAFLTMLLSILLLLISYGVSNIFNVRLAWDTPLNRADIIRKIDFTLHNGLVYPLMVSGFAIGIKMGKNFYRQQIENEQLVRQKINAEVQLLKGQIHPRFLFNSLHNIYNGMLAGSPQSPDMLLKLSDILSYILYESDDKLVPLEKEVAMLQSYLSLQNTHANYNFLVDIDKAVYLTNKQIAPLILLPLIEFGLEQTAKDEQPFLLKLEIILKDNELSFNLNLCGHLPPAAIAADNNLQLMHVKKRLQLIYPGTHNLQLTVKENNLAIALALTLAGAAYII